MYLNGSELNKKYRTVLAISGIVAAIATCHCYTTTCWQTSNLGAVDGSCAMVLPYGGNFSGSRFPGNGKYTGTMINRCSLTVVTGWFPPPGNLKSDGNSCIIVELLSDGLTSTFLLWHIGTGTVKGFELGVYWVLQCNRVRTDALQRVPLW